MIRCIPVFFLCLFLAWGTTCDAARSAAKREMPKLSSINIIDRNGSSETISNEDRLTKYQVVDFLSPQPYQKVLRIYSRDGNGNVLALITSYYPNGQIKQYLEVLNNRAYGMYREWHQNSVVKLDTFVVGGDPDIEPNSCKTWLFNGCCRAWDEDGLLEAQIPYESGVLEGLSLYYHPNGTVWKKIPTHKGVPHGKIEIFLSNGQLLQTIEYVDGVKHGSSYRHWENNRIAFEEKYENGALATGRYFDPEGRQLSSIDSGNGYRVLFGKETISELHQYQNGMQRGEIKAFDEDGNLLQLYYMQDGIKNGVETQYYTQKEVRSKTPISKLSISWSDGRIHGLVKTWYNNGVQESQREMQNNTKNGVLTSWYLDGSTMMIEDYEKDKLINGEYYLPGEKSPSSSVRGGKGTATIYDSKGSLLRKINYQNGRPELE